MYCGNCGSQLGENAEVCLKCGAGKYSNKSYCSNCGSQVLEKAVVCLNCGAAVGAGDSDTRSRLVAALLAFFLGGYGVHNFYLGYTRKAILQLSVSGACTILSCLAIPILGIIGIWVWAIVEGIQLLTGTIQTDGKGKLLKE